MAATREAGFEISERIPLSNWLATARSQAAAIEVLHLNHPLLLLHASSPMGSAAVSSGGHRWSHGGSAEVCICSAWAERGVMRLSGNANQTEEQLLLVMKR
jgi:hypothetical protein